MNTVISSKLEKLKDLAKTYDLLFMVLFGSQSVGEVHPKSDIDIGIMFSESKYTMDKEIGIGVEIMDLFQTSNVDVVVLDFAEPLLLKEVAAFGIPLYERRRGLFDEYQLLFIKKFFDNAKFRRLADRRLDEFLKKRGA